MRYGSIGGLEYEIPQSRLYCLCINMALCSTDLQCICRVIRRSSMTMKHTQYNTYYIIFGRPPVGGKKPFIPWRRYLRVCSRVSGMMMQYLVDQLGLLRHYAFRRAAGGLYLGGGSRTSDTSSGAYSPYTARNRRRIGVGIPTPASDSNKLQIISIESYP